jgi:RNA polymerase sigma-70 factor (ECF subfamily)
MKRQSSTDTSVDEIAQPALRSVLEAAGRGNLVAFRRLVELYHSRLYRYAYGRLGCRQDAEDAVQEVFLAAWSALPTFRYEHQGSFPGWLFAVARNVVSQALRRNRRPIPPGVELGAIGTMEFEGTVVSERELVAAFRNMPAVQAEVLVMRFVADMPLRTVALALGKSEGAVMALQFRALRRMRKELTPR